MEADVPLPAQQENGLAAAVEAAGRALPRCSGLLTSTSEASQSLFPQLAGLAGLEPARLMPPPGRAEEVLASGRF